MGPLVVHPRYYPYPLWGWLAGFSWQTLREARIAVSKIADHRVLTPIAVLCLELCQSCTKAVLRAGARQCFVASRTLIPSWLALPMDWRWTLQLGGFHNCRLPVACRHARGQSLRLRWSLPDYLSLLTASSTQVNRTDREGRAESAWTRHVEDPFAQKTRKGMLIKQWWWRRWLIHRLWPAAWPASTKITAEQAAKSTHYYHF